MPEAHRRHRRTRCSTATAPASSAQVPATLVPESGWHFLHLFYQVDRAALGGPRGRGDGGRACPVDRGARPRRPPGRPSRSQCFAVPGHKADFGVMMAGTDLKAVHGVQVAHPGLAARAGA